MQFGLAFSSATTVAVHSFAGRKDAEETEAFSAASVRGMEASPVLSGFMFWKVQAKLTCSFLPFAKFLIQFFSHGNWLIQQPACLDFDFAVV